MTLVDLIDKHLPQYDIWIFALIAWAIFWLPADRWVKLLKKEEKDKGEE